MHPKPTQRPTRARPPLNIRRQPPGGLIAYLMGPGRAEEHRSPRVIAAWDGRDAAWQPQRNGPGEFDLELGPLIRAMRAPALAAGLPEAAPVEGQRGHVWHCSARVAPGDRRLSDEEWAGVARDLLHGAGVAVKDDHGGPRWVAIRHADDHIHIAVVLVRQDDCRRFWPYREYPRLRQAAQDIERRLGLALTASADGTAAPAPSRGEIEKARRQGKEPARVELARAVREAAMISDGPEAFISALQAAGFVAELRRAPSGDPIGFKVGRCGDVSTAGAQVFYSGSKLAPDLSMPKLLRRWADGAEPAVDEPVLPAARVRVERARRAVAAARAGVGTEDVDDIAHATGDVLAAVRDWPGVDDGLGAAADRFDRAARAPRGSGGGASSASVGLRRTARQLIWQRRVADDDDLAAMITLAVALTALMREIAAWQRERGRIHQAGAATEAAGVVAAWSRASARMVAARAHPRLAAVTPGHAPDDVRPRRGTSPSRASGQPRR